MFGKKKILAVVPARSGSKGIRNKNLKKIQGHSLIGWAGKTLSELKWIDAQVLSTDSKAYVAEGQRYGLDAPFLRPPHLSTDAAGAVETLQHALLFCERHYQQTFDIVLIIEPTSPLRTKKDIEACVRMLVRRKIDSVITVSPLHARSHPRKIFEVSKGRLVYFHKEGGKIKGRQQLSGSYFWRNGLCYALTRDCLMKKSAVITKNTMPVIVDRPVSNIDDPIDLEWAAFLMKRRTV